MQLALLLRQCWAAVVAPLQLGFLAEDHEHKDYVYEKLSDQSDAGKVVCAPVAAHALVATCMPAVTFVYMMEHPW